ncbi:neurotrypsin-like [Pecten maximus]|uniref:neurotrypsin-like n=1 Tax=Pecten maximus TaxID=6579 RepID=UPI001458DD1B|nr:neurotrypsin-like [Pecten maximus]
MAVYFDYVVLVGLVGMTTCFEGTLRLIGGDDQYEGRLEVYHDGEWQSVCNDYWNDDNTIVACRQLGLKGGSWKNGDSGDGTFWLTDVDCDGTEDRIENCYSKPIVSTKCKDEHNAYVYQTCKPPKGKCNHELVIDLLIQLDGVLRLQDGPIQNEGRLEIYHDEEWRAICDHKWNTFPQNAHVACRQLGYKGGSSRTAGYLERSRSLKFWMDDIKCLGNETHIQDCSFRGWGIENCYYYFDQIYVACDEYKGGSDQYEGRLEVYHAGQWGSVCIYRWDNFVLNAHVACRQLGHTGGSFRPVTVTERGEGQFWLDGIECNGDEVNLNDCNFNGLGSENCSHSENDDVFLQCNPNEGAVQLVDGTNRYNGLVQVFNNGNWKSLCNDVWTNDNLNVVCRQFGTTGNRSEERDFPDGLYFSGDFLCRGSEEYILKCLYRDRACSSRERVVVTCGIPASSRNGRCDIDLQETCEETLTCQEVNGFGRCVCNDESFWDGSTNKCKDKFLFNEMCDPLIDDVCTSDLSCKPTNGSTTLKCLCQEIRFWDISIKKCRRRTSLQGIYVKDRMNITDAIAICENNYEGQLATEEHRLHVFPKCMDFAEDIWVMDTSFFMAENLSESCAKVKPRRGN